MRPLNIGLTDEQRTGVINLLNRDLSDSYIVLIKTKKFHWDVVGPQFRSLHEIWEEQYQALSENIDAIAAHNDEVAALRLLQRWLRTVNRGLSHVENHPD